jgi:hypothetical protein
MQFQLYPNLTALHVRYKHIHNEKLAFFHLKPPIVIIIKITGVCKKIDFIRLTIETL